MVCRPMHPGCEERETILGVVHRMEPQEELQLFKRKKKKTNEKKGVYIGAGKTTPPGGRWDPSAFG